MSDVEKFSSIGLSALTVALVVMKSFSRAIPDDLIAAPSSSSLL